MGKNGISRSDFLNRHKKKIGAPKKIRPSRFGSKEAVEELLAPMDSEDGSVAKENTTTQNPSAVPPKESPLQGEQGTKDKVISKTIDKVKTEVRAKVAVGATTNAKKIKQMTPPKVQMDRPTTSNSASELKLSKPKLNNFSPDLVQKANIYKTKKSKTLILRHAIPSSGVEVPSSTADTIKSDLTENRANTDTIPTQHRHNTDTNKVNTEKTCTDITDTIPTQIDNPVEPKEAIAKVISTINTDTIPTQINLPQESIADTKVKRDISTNSNLQKNTDTIPTQIKCSDVIIPTQYRHNNTDLRTEPPASLKTRSESLSSYNRHNTDTKIESEQISSDSITDTIPTQIKYTQKTPFITDTIPAQYQHNADTIPTPHPTQYRHKINSITDTKNTVRSLRGIKLQLFDYCYNTLLKLESARFRTTYDSLALHSKVPSGSVRTSLKRLKQQGFVTLEALGKGRGALIEIAIPMDIENSYSKIKISDPSIAITDTTHSHKHTYNRHNTDTTSDTNPSSKLVSHIITPSLTKEGHTEVIDYSDVNISKLQQYGITRKQLQDANNQKLSVSASDAQDLIDKFSQYMNAPETRGVRSPAGLFVRMLQDLANGDNPLPHLQSNADMDLKDLKQQLLAAKAERDKDLHTIQSLMFDSWWEETPPGNKNQFLSSNMVKDEKLYKSAVFHKWKEEIWPKTKAGKNTSFPLTPVTQVPSESE